MAPVQHASLGASNAHRWMACPGSVRLEGALPPSPGSAYAAEGTAAHALAETCLSKGVGADDYIGSTMDGFMVTQDMADAVEVYLTECRRIMAIPGIQWWIEKRFSLDPLKPPVPMFGTADFVAWDNKTFTLYVVDLKFGMGVVVEVVNNPQLRYYGLGALCSDTWVRLKCKNVSLTIVQPRAAHPDGPVRTETLTFTELMKWGHGLLDAAKATTKPDAPLVAGKQCRWCRAAGICPAQRAHALAVAQTEFSVTEPLAVPDPETIPPAEFAHLLNQLHVLEDFATAMRQTAQARLERGEEVPGWKLVEKRAVRSWAVDEEAVAAHLTGQGWRSDEMFDYSLKSVAQIEKLAGGKKKFAEAVPAEMIQKKSSGLRLAPDSDPAPAVILSAGSEFPMLPANTGSTGEEI